MSARRKHAGRTTPTPGAAAAALRVTVHLDAAKRGVVIGAQGAAVKETQRAYCYWSTPQYRTGAHSRPVAHWH